MHLVHSHTQFQLITLSPILHFITCSKSTWRGAVKWPSHSVPWNIADASISQSKKKKKKEMALLKKDFLLVNTCCHPEITFHISIYHVQVYFLIKKFFLSTTDDLRIWNSTVMECAIFKTLVKLLRVVKGKK